MKSNRHSEQIEKIAWQVWGIPNEEVLVKHDLLMLAADLLAAENRREFLSSCERYLPGINRLWRKMKEDAEDGKTEETLS